MIDLVEGINKQDIGLIAIEEIPVGECYMVMLGEWEERLFQVYQ